MRSPFQPATPSADPLGAALRAFYFDEQADAHAEVRCSVADDDRLRADYLFRTAAALPPFEKLALAQARGRVLDVGAGAGAHSLPLHARGLAVTSLDASAGAVEILRDRGLPDVRLVNIWDPLPPHEQWDTVLLLMNGLGLPGTIDGLQRYLHHLRPHLAPGAQILGTSCDVAYLYEDEDGGIRLPVSGDYYGEVQYQMTYGLREIGEPFPWLYLNAALLEDYAAEVGFRTEILRIDKQQQYLARLIPLSD